VGASLLANEDNPVSDHSKAAAGPKNS
jgi:hypothetical protein